MSANRRATDMSINFSEEGWRRFWSEFNIDFNKDTTMCTSRDAYEKRLAAEAKAAIGQPTVGSKWVYMDEVLTVKQIGLKYWRSSGDPTLEYAVVESKLHGDTKLVTHKALMRDCKPWVEPPKDVYVKLASILAANPCDTGVVALGAIVANGEKHGKAWQAALALGQQNMDREFRVSSLFEAFMAMYGHEPETSWLLFLCNVSHMLPKGMTQGPDRATMKRLLGIQPE